MDPIGTREDETWRRDLVDIMKVDSIDDVDPGLVEFVELVGTLCSRVCLTTIAKDVVALAVVVYKKTNGGVTCR